jgi:pSer/pThr/pTyr-binding forkhead associated (FHA) protein
VEIAWSVVAVLFLVIVVMGLQWFNSRTAADKARAELEQANRRANDAESRHGSAERDLQAARDEARLLADRLNRSETTREAGGFDADRTYKLLAKGSLESPEGRRTYGVVQEDSGAVRSFLVDETLDHLDEGDCFGVLRGKLAKLSENEFKLESGTADPEATGEPQEVPESVTQVRESPQLDADTQAPAATQEAPQKTVLFVAKEPEQAEDPNKGLPYLAVGDGEEDRQVHHLPFDRVTAGREGDNDIVLEDQNASRRHFIVSFNANRFLLKDNDSTNGTRCNGERVGEKWLEFGDRIEVGDTVIEFSCDGYDLKDKDPTGAIAALEECVERQPDFIDALKLLAFMLERNVARRKEAASYWQRIARLETSR